MATQRPPLAVAMLALRLGWGSLLLVRPGAVLAGAGHADAGEGDRAVARVLGARHLAQAAVQLAMPSPAVRDLGAVVDGLHAASALTLAIASPHWRKTALLDGTLAGTFGATDALA